MKYYYTRDSSYGDQWYLQVHQSHRFTCFLVGGSGWSLSTRKFNELPSSYGFPIFAVPDTLVMLAVGLPA